MFVKLNLSHSIPKDFFEVVHEYSNTVDNQRYSVLSYSLNDLIKEQLLFIIPVEYRADFICNGLEYDVPELFPHLDPKDPKVVTKINFYLETCGGTTSFYKENKNSKKYIVPDDRGGSGKSIIFERSGLEHVSSFVAETGDIYCFDMNWIHGVEKKQEIVRSMYSLTTHLSFEKVCEILKKYIN